MKLTMLKQEPAVVVTEAAQYLFGDKIDVTALADKATLKLIADEVYEKGFPENFGIKVELLDNTILDLVFELDEKKINSEPGYHTLTFTYTHSAKTMSAVRKKLDAVLAAEENEGDMDKYDTLYDLLSVDSLYVTVEFGKEIAKVFATIK